jgi:hypothetical protein
VLADFVNASPVYKDAQRSRFDRALYELDGGYARVVLIGAEEVAGAAAAFLNHTMEHVVP